jgi:peptidyl-prolyl cis-trans isomerase D
MDPAFTEVAFSLPVGQISEPVRTPYGYHLIEVLEQDRVADTDSIYQVHARHILMRVTPGPQTQEMLRDSAEDFRARVNAGNFVTTAQAEALDLVEPEPFPAGRDIPGLRQTMAGASWTLATDPGSVSPVFENDQFLYVVLAEKPLPAGLAPLDDVRPRVALAVRRDFQRQAAVAKLSPAIGEVQMGTSMAEAAAAHGLKHAVTDTFLYSGNVPDVGYATEFNEKVFGGQVGELITDIETVRGVYAAIPRWISPVDENAYLAQRDNLTAMLRSRAQGERFEAWLQEREDEAEIVDNRYRRRAAS